MSPSFDNHDNHEDDIDEPDFTDLREQYEVRLEEGLDAFVVLDGLPVVPAASKPKLVKFLLKQLVQAGKVGEDQIHMPINEETQMTDGYAFVEYENAAQAAFAVRKFHDTPLDKKHTMKANKLTDIERYGKEGKVDEDYKEPAIPAFEPQDHLRDWLKDAEGRDQMVIYKGDNVGIYWSDRENEPEKIVERQRWTDTFTQWSPKGTYLATMHAQGVQLWGGKQWNKKVRIAHPGVNLIDFSPDERYLTTWSHQPLEVDENNKLLSKDEDGKNYIIWDLSTERPLRSFVNLVLDTTPEVDKLGNVMPKRKLQWPAFKWSCDAKYVARLTPKEGVSIYELPSMVRLDKKDVKIEGIVDFEWCPAPPHRDSVKTYEQLFCYWTPEIRSNPAKVGLMSIPSREIVRTRNLFNVNDAKLHWQSDSAYVCVKVDRQKSKKSLATNLEIFRVKEKGVPVEVIDSIKDTVINFAWEPKGDRFVLITAGEMVEGAAVAPKTAVSFYCPEKARANVVGNFRLIRTIEKKNNNAIHWCPNGRFVVVATVLSQQSYDLDFWDLDFEGEKDEDAKDLTANLQLMNSGDHYGVTDIEWDPSGRFVASSASAWKHRMENGYHLYDFKGTVLREDAIEGFQQWSWRPRPGRLLSKEQQKEVRRNLREYSRVFDEEDAARRNTADKEVIDKRREKLNEWLAWREKTEEQLLYDRIDLGLPEISEERAALEGDGDVETDGGDGQLVEFEQEEVIDETIEVIE